MEGGRTDNQVLDAEPVKCQLGDKIFALVPQARSKGRRFRKRFEELQEAAEGTSMSKADGLIDLVYEYDSTLGDRRDWIEENATDAQLVAVFIAIYEFTCGPFVKQLPRAIEDLTSGMASQ